MMIHCAIVRLLSVDLSGTHVANATAVPWWEALNRSGARRAAHRFSASSTRVGHRPGFLLSPAPDGQTEPPDAQTRPATTGDQG